MNAASLVITDPQTVPTYGDGPIRRWCEKNLAEARDEVFIRLTLARVATQLALMTGIWFAIHHAPIPSFIPMAIYFALWGYLTPPVILMLHCAMHRPFIKVRWLDKAHPILMSSLLGIPLAYRDHHTGMHHAADNMSDDASSTLRYQRDSFADFLAYFARFFFLGWLEVPRYFRQKNRAKIARRAFTAELTQTVLVAGSLLVDWRFSLVVFVLPWFTCRFMMMVGNWGQHAFINVAKKNNGLTNATTCINSAYNKRCFNDGYHVGHHLRANRHWSEMPADFIANKEKYGQEGVIVFEGIDFFFVSVLLWTGQYKTLARRFVRLGGPMTDDEVIALLKDRVKVVSEWPAEKIGVAVLAREVDTAAE